MSTHKFKLGQIVFLERNGLNRGAAPCAYEVNKQLPEKNSEFEYQVKSSSERHARVVKESELSKE